MKTSELQRLHEVYVHACKVCNVRPGASGSIMTFEEDIPTYSSYLHTMYLGKVQAES